MKTRSATVMFVCGLVIAGLANALGKLITKRFAEMAAPPEIMPFFSTMMFCVNLMIYLFLLLFWIRSVRQRLLPARERSYLIGAAICAIGMLALRSVKYRLISEGDLDLARYIWYLYYLPMILMPTLFIMTCLKIDGKSRVRCFDERLLLIPASVMILLFLTNDLHHLAFRPNGDTVMTGANASYFNHVLFYLYYAYYVVTVGAGLFLLTRANRRLHSLRKTLLPFVFLLGMLALALIDKTLNWVRLPSMYTAPEIVSFGMVGIFESCVRNRLIPYNENYAGFFSATRFPAVITRRDFQTVYRSAQPLTADERQLERSLRSPVYLDPDTKLMGKSISAGCAFYTEDESELHRLNERLAEANELIASENDLIQAENELKVHTAAVDSRNMIYSRVSAVMLPYHKRALELLDAADPDSSGFRQTVARLNVLNAFIKRGTNLLLTETGESAIPVSELAMALRESADYLTYCGITAGVMTGAEGRIDRETALAIYMRFEAVIESLLDNASDLHIALNGEELRIAAACQSPPAPIGQAELRESDGVYYYIVNGEGRA